MNDAEIKSVIEGLDEITGYSCEQMSLFDNDVFIRKMANDALSVIRELKAENERLRQEKDDALKRVKELDIPCVGLRSYKAYMQGFSDAVTKVIDIITEP